MEEVVALEEMEVEEVVVEKVVEEEMEEVVVEKVVEEVWGEKRTVYWPCITVLKHQVQWQPVQTCSGR